MIEHLLRQPRQCPRVAGVKLALPIALTVLAYGWQQQLWSGWVLIPLIFSLAAIQAYGVARIRQGRIEQLSALKFNPVFWRRFLQRYPQVGIRERRLIEQGFKDYLALHIMRRYAFAMPSQAVDALWHVMLEFPAEYRQLCQQAIGRPLTHQPFTVNHNPLVQALNQQQQQRQLFNTWHISCSLAGLNPRNSPMLPRLFAIDQALQWPNATAFSLPALHALYDQFRRQRSRDESGSSDHDSDGCSSCSSCGGGGD